MKLEYEEFGVLLMARDHYIKSKLRQALCDTTLNVSEHPEPSQRTNLILLDRFSYELGIGEYLRRKHFDQPVVLVLEKEDVWSVSRRRSAVPPADILIFQEPRSEAKDQVLSVWYGEIGLGTYFEKMKKVSFQPRYSVTSLS